MNRELNFGWTSLPNLGVFRDSSREPVSPVGTYRSASRPDENLNRWSMPRWAVSTKLMFSGVFPLFVYWELYGTMILHELGFPFKQPLYYFFGDFPIGSTDTSQMFPRYSVWESLLAQNTLVWALVSTYVSLGCGSRPSAIPVWYNGDIWWYMGIWITWT